MEFLESEFLIETEVPEDELIISRTDLKGKITYVNETFCKISGYSVEELIGKPHNIVRHPDMPSSVFEELWKTLKSGKKWNGIIKNLRKDKGFYWVMATISAVYKDGELVEYKSLRAPVEYATKLHFQKLYDTMRAENKENIRKIIYTKG